MNLQNSKIKPTICKICRSETKLFDVIDLARQCSFTPYPNGLLGVPIYYNRCINCNLLFTSDFDAFTKEEWQSKIYNSEYNSIDPDFSGARALRNCAVLKSVVRGWWTDSSSGCDFGGGNGVLAAAMRDEGFKFDSIDPFGKNEIQSKTKKYSILSAFEVLEHSVDPLVTFAEIVRLGENERFLILISTLLAPNKLKQGELIKWWYAGPRNGHVTLFSDESMQFLARLHNIQYRRVTRGFHLFGTGYNLEKISRNILKTKVLQKIGLI